MTYPGVAPSGFIFHSTADAGLHSFDQILGDVSGILNETVVRRIHGQLVDSQTPVSGNILQHDGEQWSVTDSMSLDHNLLSATHDDTTSEGPLRGALIYGSGASPLWTRLDLGTAEFVLRSDGTDLEYTRLGQNTPFELGTVALPSHTYTGDIDTGHSAPTPDTLVSSASGIAILTVAETDAGERITLDGAQVVRSRAVGATEGMLNDDYVVLATAVPITLTLPDAPATNQIVIVKDRDGLAAGGSRITIDGAGGTTIDGNVAIQIQNSYGAFTLLYNGTEWNVI